MDADLRKLLERAFEAQGERCDAVICFRGKPVTSVYQGMRALYKRAGLKAIHTHDLRRTSATYVHKALGGNMQAAAEHITDTVATAQRHYVQPDPHVQLPVIEALSDMLANAPRPSRNVAAIGAP